MDLRISLSPTGGLRLHVPSSRQRTLDIPTSFEEKVECPCCGERSRVLVVSSALRIIKRILRNAEDYVPGREKRGHIGAFPTQEVIEAWKREDDAAKEEAAKKRAAEKQAAEEAAWAEKGIDVKALEFKL